MHTAIVGASSTWPTLGRAVLGIAVSLTFVLGGLLLEGGHLTAVTSLSAFMIVAAGCAAAMVVGLRLGSRAARFSSLAKAAVGMGVVGQVIGMIHVMENLDRPENIGPGLAVAFVAALYGCLLWALFRALHHAEATRMVLGGESVEADPETLEAPALALAGVMTLLFVTFVVLYSLNVPAPR